MRPEVSVILPVRNGGPFLQEAVDSILGQTLGELELLVVDDHSSDGAPQALEVSDPRCRIVPATGRGVARAFNCGFERAAAPWIARMDADDIALPQRLELQLAYLRRHPDIDIAGGRVELFAAEPLRGGNRHYQRWLNSLRHPEAIRRALFIESPVPNPTALFRRASLERLGGYRDGEWPEDYDLYLRADRLGMRMGKPAETVLRWRDHSSRLTRSDARYGRRRFQQAKAHFLVHGRLPDQPIIIWGAGPTGRTMHDLLVAEGASVEGFIEVHPRRVGGVKRGKPVWSPAAAAEPHGCMVLVAVGARGARAEIRAFLERHRRREGSDFLFVA